MAAAVLRVGLTGNIAAGKSTVSAYMKELGCRIVDLDTVAHACMLPGEPSHRAIVDAFGEEFLRPDGTIDRAKLGELVFADDEARTRLEEILHPAVRNRERELLERMATSAESGIFVAEAALLYETGGAERYDRMVVVTAPDELRLQRLVARGLSSGEARRRMSTQMDQDVKAEMADYVIANGGSISQAREKAREVVGLLWDDLERRKAGKPLGEPSGID